MQRRIIVVEDEPDLSDPITLHLRREGYAGSGPGDVYAAARRDGRIPVESAPERGAKFPLLPPVQP